MNLTLRDFLHFTFRNKQLIFAPVVLSLFVALAVDLFATPRYLVSASLLVKTGGDSVLRDRENSTLQAEDRKNIVYSDMDLLHARDLLSTVLGRVKPETLYPSLAQNKALMDRALDHLDHDLSFASPRDTTVIRISYLNANPVVGSVFVQALCDEFLNRQIQLYSNPQLPFLTRQLAEAKSQLDAAEQALESFRAVNHIATIDDERSALDRQRLELEAQTRTARVNVAELVSRLNYLHAERSRTPEFVELYSDNDLRFRSVDDAQQRLTDLQIEEKKLSLTYRDDSEPLLRVRAQIGTLQKRLHELVEQKQSRNGMNPIRSQIDADITQAQSSLAGIGASLNAYTSEYNSLKDKASTLEALRSQNIDLQRKYDLADSTYRTYARNVEEARVADDLNLQHVGTVAVAGVPVVSDRPVRPQKILNLALGLVGGLVIGIALSFGREMLSEVVTSPSQLERETGLPVLVSFSLD